MISNGIPAVQKKHAVRQGHPKEQLSRETPTSLRGRPPTCRPNAPRREDITAGAYPLLQPFEAVRNVSRIIRYVLHSNKVNATTANMSLLRRGCRMELRVCSEKLSLLQKQKGLTQGSFSGEANASSIIWVHTALGSSPCHKCKQVDVSNSQ
jgi:hypothetical protein